MKEKKIKDKKIVNIFSNQKGMALLTTLIFTFVLVTFGVALLTMTSNDSKLSTLQRESTRAFYLAETGIEKAIWYINFSSDNLDGLSWRGTLHEEGENSTEYFDTHFEADEVDANGSTIATLVSTGTVDDGSQFSKGTRAIEVRLIKGVITSPGMTYNHAILTDGDMTLNGGISISGNIHANGFLTNNGIIDFAEGGKATAEVGTNDSDLCSVNNKNITPPEIDWAYFERKVNPDYPDIHEGEHLSSEGKYYGYNTSVEFNTPDELVGIHYVDGDVTIKTELKLTNATIFATGTITVLGNGDVTLGNKIEDHPLALIAKGDIIIGGSVHGEGIIQSTEGSFTSNGVVDINEGVIYAKEGIFNGGGGAEFNVKYPTALSKIPIPGIGVEAWKKTSWQEVY